MQSDKNITNFKLSSVKIAEIFVPHFCGVYCCNACAIDVIFCCLFWLLWFLQPLASAYGLAKHRDGRWEWAIAPGVSPSPRYQHAAVGFGFSFFFFFVFVP